MKTWIRLAALVLVFCAGLWAGQSGILKQVAFAQDGGAGSGSVGSLAWTDDGATIELTNFDPEVAYAVVVTLEDELSYLAIGGDVPIVHVEETLAIEKLGLKTFAAYRMEPVIAMDEVEIVRPCDDPIVDCPQPGRPPVPPWLKTGIVAPTDLGPGGSPGGSPKGGGSSFP